MGKPLWTAYEAASATGGMLCARGGDPDRWEAEEWMAGGIAIDSRTIQPGEIFVAVKDVRDGHDFVDAAFAAGASAALVTRPPADAPDGKPFLVVRDTMEGLRDLARAARLRNFGKRIAVTGSAGKTSTKEMLRTMLSDAGPVHAADRSFNNHLGVPLTLASMPSGARYGVFEIGMNHAGEIIPLVNLVRPHAAIITTVNAAHLEFFDSVEGIAEAKAEIFTGIKPGGTAILPRDNAHYDLLRHRAKASPASTILTFGRSDDADARLVGTDPFEDGAGQWVDAELMGSPLRFALGAPGEHQAMNALAALLAAGAIGVGTEQVLAGLKAFVPGAGRGAQTRLILPGGAGAMTLLDESYNANPASMAAAIQLMGTLPKSNTGARRIAVLGEMLELGHSAPALHAGLADSLLQNGIDQVHVTGPLMDYLWEALPCALRGEKAADAQMLTKKITERLHDGDIIMVKGSNASKVSRVAAGLRTHCQEMSKQPASGTDKR
ncbi:MAG: UDP-N-acetylmuramoyl-tripeptide--D-alanyl-D-alanine ligase [Pseudomonadota bacterium]